MRESTIISGLRSSAAGLVRDERGTFAIMFGAAAMAVMLCAGVAVDYARISSARTAVASSLDAAVLAAAHDASSGKSADAVRETFDSFMASNLATSAVDADDVRITGFSVDRQTGRVTANAKTNVELAFLGVTGKDRIAVGTQAEAIYSTTKVELSMMLDVTGSMATGGKLVSLKQAASKAVNILLPESGGGDKMRIGIVPYSVSVNAGAYAPKVFGGAAGQFATERWDGEKFTDASPSASPLLARASYGPAQPVVALTDDPAPLLSSIAAFRPIGGTAGHIGVAWSYYMLSPDWRTVWSAASRPANYNANGVQKIALLMTDGEFNTIYPPSRTSWSSSDFAVELCDSMKRDGIIVYAIAFSAPAAAERTLRKCATRANGSNQYYFSASNGAELTAAFEKIALDIRALRLSK